MRARLLGIVLILAVAPLAADAQTTPDPLAAQATEQRDQVGQARRAADETRAGIHAWEPYKEGMQAEADGERALQRRDYRGAVEQFRAARDAYRRAADAARERERILAANPPVDVARLAVAHLRGGTLRVPLPVVIGQPEGRGPDKMSLVVPQGRAPFRISDRTPTFWVPDPRWVWGLSPAVPVDAQIARVLGSGPTAQSGVNLYRLAPMDSPPRRTVEFGIDLPWRHVGGGPPAPGVIVGFGRFSVATTPEADPTGGVLIRSQAALDPGEYGFVQFATRRVWAFGVD